MKFHAACGGKVRSFWGNVRDGLTRTGPAASWKHAAKGIRSGGNNWGLMPTGACYVQGI